MGAQLLLNGTALYTNHVMTFGEKLRQRRKEKGVSLYDLGSASGINEPNLVAIEKGRRPASDAVLRKLADCKLLDLNYYELKCWQMMAGATPEQLETLAKELLRMKADAESQNQ